MQNNHNKQHGFYFNADNCIMCHSCEVACGEKNSLPPYLAFRKVGYLETGTYPNVKRLNISMACNHCDDPVCLQGCPTKAYTKYNEYGAVVHDPELCIGCRYCTWVCPFDAPAYDPAKGTTGKCNMCIDNLEKKLQPACVDACLGKALDFGVMGDIEKEHKTMKKEIPGLPDMEMTQPNIYFKQSIPPIDEFKRGDNIPLVYKNNGVGISAVFSSTCKTFRGFHLKRLWSHENPLILFTLLVQMAAGAFISIYTASLFGLDMQKGILKDIYQVTLFILAGIMALALSISTKHLGRPQYCFLAINNLKSSWVSREVLTVNLFFGLLFILIANRWFDFLHGYVNNIIQFSGLCLALITLFSMSMVYRIKARPFWNHWNTFAAFFSSALILGPILVSAVAGFKLQGEIAVFHGIYSLLAALIIFGVALQFIGQIFHFLYLKKKGGEAEISCQQMLTTFRYTCISRNIGLAVVGVLTFGMGFTDAVPLTGLLILFFLALLVETIGRGLFYVLAVSVSLPGAFFWKNREFESFARKTGLAENPAVGIAPM